MPIDFTKRKPRTIDEAIVRIVKSLTPSEVQYIKSNDQHGMHFTVGMTMRNNWGFWKEDSPIKRDFKKRFNLFGHGDDLSGVILDGVWASVCGQDVNKILLETAEEFRKHWKKSGINPITGECGTVPEPRSSPRPHAKRRKSKGR